MIDTAIIDEIRSAESDAARTLGRKGGKASAAMLTTEQRKRRARKGGRASAAALTPAQRTARARNAVTARWSKRAEAVSGAREGRAKP